MLVSLPLPFPSSELYIVESGKASCTLMSVVVAQCFSYLSFSSFKRESIKKKSGTLPLTSVHFSCSVMSDSLRPHGLQHARLPCPSPTPWVYSNSWPLSRDAIQPSHPVSSPSPPTFNHSQHQGLFKWISSSHQEAKVLEFQLQHQSFQCTSRTDLL